MLRVKSWGIVILRKIRRKNSIRLSRRDIPQSSTYRTPLVLEKDEFYLDAAFICGNSREMNVYWWKCFPCDVQQVRMEVTIDLPSIGGLKHNVQFHGWKDTPKSLRRMRKRLFPKLKTLRRIERGDV